MKLYLSLLALFLLSVTQVFGQDNATLSGLVIDENGTPLPYVSVAVWDTTAGEIKKGSVTDGAGQFDMQVEPGSYQVAFSYLSYQEQRIDIELIAGETVEMGTIEMQPRTENLDEVVVRAERSQMEMKFDRRVFSVGQDIVNIGGSAVDVLDNLPSVTTDIEGNISLRGSGNVRLLINGKPANAAGETGDELQSIPANLIERVEVITNPSARYDAEGEAGIINVILKKSRKRGLNGSVDLSTGYPHNHEVATNLNYRMDNVNLFGSVDFEYRSRPGDGFSLVNYNGPDTTYSYRQNRESTRGGFDGGLRLGVEFFLPANQTLTVQGDLDLEDGLNEQKLTYRDFNQNGILTSLTERFDEEAEKEGEVEGEINYEKKFDDFDDHKLTSNLEFEFETETEDSDIREENADQVVTERQRSSNEEITDNARWQIDYVRPLSENHRYELGTKAEYRLIENNYRVEEEINGNWQVLPLFNENFRYTEIVGAAYAIHAYDFGDWSYQAGVRAEYTDVKTELLRSNAEGSNNYIDLFPSASLTYELNERQSIQASYSRRLNRPWYRLILPFSNYTDDRNRYVGNPDLNPEFSDSYELSFLNYHEGGSIFTSIYFRDRTGVIERITTQSPDGDFLIELPINLATRKSYGLELTVTQDITEGLSLNGGFNFFGSNTDGAYNGETLSAETSSYFGRLRLQYRMDGWNAQATGFYRGERETTQGIDKPFSVVNLALAKQFWNQQATISLNVRDLLNTRQSCSVVDQQYLYEQERFRWSSRSITLGFTYRFNQDRNDRRRNGEFRGGGDMGDDMNID